MGIVEIVVPRFRVLDREMEVRDAFHRLPRAERDVLRLARLNTAWRRAARGSPWYSRLVRETRLPLAFASLDEFQELVPVTRRQDVRSHPDAFKLGEWRRGKWMLTGGSTGAPTQVFWALEGHLESLRDQYWARSWWDVHVFDRQAMLWGHAHSLGRGIGGMCRRLMMPMVDVVRGRIRFNAYRLDRDALRWYFDRMVRFRPVSLYAYASAAHLLAVTNRGRQPAPDSLKVAFLAAEPIIDTFRKSIRDVFGCPSAGEYGSIDCGMIAYEHPGGMYRVFERSVIVETVRREAGYDVVVTQLRDTGFPLFRYEIGDMAAAPMRRGPNGCDVLEGINGRSYDMLRSPGGAVCYGGAVTQIIKHVPDVALFTVKQRYDYSLLIEVQTCTGEDLSSDEKHYIARGVAKVLGRGVPVEVQATEYIERTMAGKHRWITSEVVERGEGAGNAHFDGA